MSLSVTVIQCFFRRRVTPMEHFTPVLLNWDKPPPAEGAANGLSLLTWKASDKLIHSSSHPLNIHEQVWN